MNMRLTRMLMARGYCAPADEDGSQDGTTSEMEDMDTEEAARARGDFLGEKEEEPEAEPEEEDEAEAEAEDESDKEAAEDASKTTAEKPNKDFMIPKSRYDSKAAHAKAVEEENARLRAELEKARPKDQEEAPTITALDRQLDELDAKVIAAAKDGDTDAQLSLMAEQRKLQRQRNELFEQAVVERARNEVKGMTESEKLDHAITDVISNNPVLDQDSDQYDDSVVDEVADLQEAFIAKGVSPADALYRAVNYVIRNTGTGAPEQPQDRPVDKKVTDIKKNLKTASSQPPSNQKVGDDNGATGMKGDVLDVADLSEEEFDALPESTLRKLRGDDAA